jgi:hypothetical protein
MFSVDDMEIMLWLLQINGVANVPSTNELKSSRKRLQSACGVKSHKRDSSHLYDGGCETGRVRPPQAPAPIGLDLGLVLSSDLLASTPQHSTRLTRLDQYTLPTSTASQAETQSAQIALDLQLDHGHSNQLMDCEDVRVAQIRPW